MKKVTSIVVTICLICISLAFFVTPGQADTQENSAEALEEALSVAKDSYLTLRLLTGGYRSLSRVVEPSEFWKDMDVLARNKGYIPADYYGKEPPLRYGDRMTSIAAWKEELSGYLDDDFLDRYMPTFEKLLVYEKDGGTFARSSAEWTDENEVDWSTARIILQDQDTITFSVISKNEYSSEFDEECTVIMRKTADGWRVAGGTLFDAFIGLIPPKTGEHTAIYALIFTLAVLPLGVFAIGAFKKRKERFSII